VAPDQIKLSFAIATDADAAALASLHCSVAEKLTTRYGHGPWSWVPTEKGVLRDLGRPQFVRILVARKGSGIVGTLRLATKKPWAIDTAYFSSAQRPLYLTSMAVSPDLQGKGIGRRLLHEAEAVARGWPGDAIRLDAFDSDAGAGPFYAKCGYREVGRVTYRKAPLVYFELQM
jgi:GNAT superfamily N-acetyltransferase